MAPELGKSAKQVGRYAAKLQTAETAPSLPAVTGRPTNQKEFNQKPEFVVVDRVERTGQECREQPSDGDDRSSD
jgi:hypothetical protein